MTTAQSMTFSEAINYGLCELFAGPEPAMFLGMDIGKHGGTFGVSRGLYDKFGPDVIRDAPLCESGIVGFAVGLAISGVRAVAEIEFMDFATVAMDQIVNQAAKLHYFTGGALRVPLLLRMPSMGPAGAGAQHSQNFESWFMHVPGLKMAAPSNAADALGLLRTALADPNPVIFVEHAQLYGKRAPVDVSAPPVPFGQARIARPGSDVTIVTWGVMVDMAEAAAAQLAERGVDAEVLDLRTLSPLDEEAILSSLAKTHRLVVVHESPRRAGPGAEIAALCLEKGFDYLDAPVERVGSADVPIPYGPPLREVFPSLDQVVAAADRTLGVGADG